MSLSSPPPPLPPDPLDASKSSLGVLGAPSPKTHDKSRATAKAGQTGHLALSTSGFVNAKPPAAPERDASENAKLEQLLVEGVRLKPGVSVTKNSGKDSIYRGALSSGTRRVSMGAALELLLGIPSFLTCPAAPRRFHVAQE